MLEHNGSGADNLFFGAQHFFTIKELEFMIPNSTLVRVNRSPAPDHIYFVNERYLLQSRGGSQPNMSAVPAPKGIYGPRKVLSRMFWSITCLDLR